MPRNIVRGLSLAALGLATACTFATELPGEEDIGLDGGATPTALRCQTSGLAVCIDFEDMPKPTDGIAPGAAIMSNNVLAEARAGERAADFATGSELRIADTTKLDIARTWTVEMWTRPQQVPPDSGDKQVGLFDTHLQYQVNFEWDRRVECRIFDATTSENVDSAVQLAVDQWHHVACTYDGAQLRVYVDGKLEGCASSSLTISNAGTFGAAVGANMDIGPTYENRFVGQLDNVHLYARTLTANDICTLWGGGGCDNRCPTSGGPGPGPDNDND